MSDIVERLEQAKEDWINKPKLPDMGSLCGEAAEELKRLRIQLDKKQIEIDIMCMTCPHISDN